MKKNPHKLSRLARRYSLDSKASIKTGPLSSMACKVVDISATGARLQLDQHKPLPTSFVLSIPSENKHRKMRRRCQVHWKSGLAIGVSFI